MITTYTGNSVLIDKKINDLLNTVDELNIVVLDAPDKEKLLNSLSYAPVFSIKRVVVIRSLVNLQTIPTDVLISILQNKNSQTHLVISLPDGIKDIKLKKWLKANSGFERIINLKTKKHYSSYVQRESKKLNLTFAGNSIDYFLHVVGLDISSIDTELKILATHNSSVNMAEIDKYTTRRSELNLGFILDNIFSKDLKEALNLVNQYVQNKGNIQKLVNILYYNLHIALIVKSSRRIGETEFHPYSISKVRKYVRDTSLDRLINFYEAIAQLKIEYNKELLKNKLIYSIYEYKVG